MPKKVKMSPKRHAGDLQSDIRIEVVIEITPESECSSLVLVTGKLVIDVTERDALIEVLVIDLTYTVLVNLLIRNGLLCRPRNL